MTPNQLIKSQEEVVKIKQNTQSFYSGALPYRPESRVKPKKRLLSQTPHDQFLKGVQLSLDQYAKENGMNANQYNELSTSMYNVTNQTFQKLKDQTQFNVEILKQQARNDIFNSDTPGKLKLRTVQDVQQLTDHIKSTEYAFKQLQKESEEGEGLFWFIKMQTEKILQDSYSIASTSARTNNMLKIDAPNPSAPLFIRHQPRQKKKEQTGDPSGSLMGEIATLEQQKTALRKQVMDLEKNAKLAREHMKDMQQQQHNKKRWNMYWDITRDTLQMAGMTMAAIAVMGLAVSGTLTAAAAAAARVVGAALLRALGSAGRYVSRMFSGGGAASESGAELAQLGRESFVQRFQNALQNSAMDLEELGPAPEIVEPVFDVSISGSALKQPTMQLARVVNNMYDTIQQVSSGAVTIAEAQSAFAAYQNTISEQMDVPRLMHELLVEEFERQGMSDVEAEDAAALQVKYASTQQLFQETDFYAQMQERIAHIEDTSHTQQYMDFLVFQGQLLNGQHEFEQHSAQTQAIQSIYGMLDGTSDINFEEYKTLADEQVERGVQGGYILNPYAGAPDPPSVMNTEQEDEQYGAEEDYSMGQAMPRFVPNTYLGNNALGFIVPGGGTMPQMQTGQIGFYNQQFY